MSGWQPCIIKTYIGPYSSHFTSTLFVPGMAISSIDLHNFIPVKGLDLDRSEESHHKHTMYVGLTNSSSDQDQFGQVLERVSPVNPPLFHLLIVSGR